MARRSSLTVLILSSTIVFIACIGGETRSPEDVTCPEPQGTGTSSLAVTVIAHAFDRTPLGGMTVIVETSRGETHSTITCGKVPLARFKGVDPPYTITVTGMIPVGTDTVYSAFTLIDVSPEHSDLILPLSLQFQDTDTPHPPPSTLSARVTAVPPDSTPAVSLAQSQGSIGASTDPDSTLVLNADPFDPSTAYLNHVSLSTGMTTIVAFSYQASPFFEFVVNGFQFHTFELYQDGASLDLPLMPTTTGFTGLALGPVPSGPGIDYSLAQSVEVLFSAPESVGPTRLFTLAAPSGQEVTGFLPVPDQSAIGDGSGTYEFRLSYHNSDFSKYLLTQKRAVRVNDDVVLFHPAAPHVLEPAANSSLPIDEARRLLVTVETADPVFNLIGYTVLSDDPFTPVFGDVRWTLITEKTCTFSLPDLSDPSLPIGTPQIMLAPLLYFLSVDAFVVPGFDLDPASEDPAVWLMGLYPEIQNSTYTLFETVE